MADIITGLEETAGSIKEALTEAEKLTAALETLNERALNGGLTLDVLNNSIKAAVDSFKFATETIAGFSFFLNEATIDSGNLESAIKVVSIGMTSMAELIGFASEAYTAIGKAMDAGTQYNREFTAAMHSQAASFGLGLAEAEKYRDYLTATARDFSGRDFGFISPADMKKASEAMGAAGISLERMSDQVVTSAGNFDILQTAFLQSKSMGMDLGNYFGLLSNAMNKQGLSTQQSAEQIAMFDDVAGATGFTVDKVASHLQGISNGFSKMGLSAAFGRPILEGFTNSLKDMGLGFENALELSSELSNAIAGLSSNYAMAYLTFQRGGLDMGGGGTALGAGIGMRARMLEAEQRGDQGQMGMEIAGAIKDTLASFTGGQIVTVKEAAASPELQQTFYTQAELLKSMYGISDTATQDRTLELLQQLSEATEAGDTDLAESIGKDIQETIETQDKTLSIQEKMSKYLEASYAELQNLNNNIVGVLGDYSNKFVDISTSFGDKVMDVAGAVKDPNKATEELTALRQEMKGLSKPNTDPEPGDPDTPGATRTPTEEADKNKKPGNLIDAIYELVREIKLDRGNR